MKHSIIQKPNYSSISTGIGNFSIHTQIGIDLKDARELLKCLKLAIKLAKDRGENRIMLGTTQWLLNPNGRKFDSMQPESMVELTKNEALMLVDTLKKALRGKRGYETIVLSIMPPEIVKVKS